jgi:hypothetical protein
MAMQVPAQHVRRLRYSSDMLREVKSGSFVPHGMWLWKRYVFVAGRARAAAGITSSLYALAREAQRTEAVVVLTDPPRRYWWCRDRFWWEDEDLEAEDVLALVHERDRRRQRRLDHAHALLAADEAPAVPRRERVPREVREAVFRRDGGRCVECGSDFDLQYDHVIPVALGGANTLQNLQILCAPCNGRKGARLG